MEGLVEHALREGATGVLMVVVVAALAVGGMVGRALAEHARERVVLEVEGGPAVHVPRASFTAGETLSLPAGLDRIEARLRYGRPAVYVYRGTLVRDWRVAAWEDLPLVVRSTRGDVTLRLERSGGR